MIELHRGNKYTVTADGITAEKSDGVGVRKMKYYPERDIAALAGEIDELTAWQILYDVARQSEGSATPISPEHIFIDGDGFILSQWSSSHDERYTAPEGYSPVWALAATVFHTYLGCDVFQGLGGRGQTENAPVPTLRRELPQLSRLIVGCLDFHPGNRPEMADIIKTAQENMARCKAGQKDVPPLKKLSENIVSGDETDVYWPEEMY